jgi:hypothetical protein
MANNMNTSSKSIDESIEDFKNIAKDTNKMMDEMGISGAEATLMMLFLFGLMLGVIPSAIIIGWYRIPPLFGVDSILFSIIGAILGLGVGIGLTRTLSYIADRIMRKDLNQKNTEFDKLLDKATQGDAESQYELADIYAIGEKVPQNYQEAMKWLTLAANQGFIEAQQALAEIYLDVDRIPEIPKNAEEGIKWLKLAANQGDVSSQKALAGIYFESEFAPTNIDESIKWFTLAANQGDAESQYYLGAIYEEGQNIPQNREEAIKWFKLAANQGYVEAKEWLETLNLKEN